MEKTTKSRLEELQELHTGGYITEGEYKIARINVLRDGGIDVITQLQQTRRQYMQVEEAPRSGCGCFLMTLLLAALFVSGVAFFAAPYLPEEFGGAKVLAVRRWVTEKSAGIIDELLGGSPAAPQLEEPAEEPTEAPTETPVEEAPSETPVPSAPIVEPVAIEPVIVTPTEPDIVSEDTAAVISADIPVLPEPLSLDEPASEPPVSSDVPLGYGVVTVPSARIRSAPDTSDNNVVGWGRSGDRLTVIEEAAGSDRATWYRVTYGDGGTGWIRGTLLRLDN